MALAIRSQTIALWLMALDKNKNYLALKKFCQNEGADLFGVAGINGIKNEFQLSPKILAKLDKAICLGVMISSSILAEIEEKPTRLYFHHYRIVNSFLDQTALKLGNLIQKKGFLALAIPATQIIDWEKNTAHLSHRKLGVLAGFGWICRNNLLVNEKLGSQFRLVSILTDMPLRIDKPKDDDCGSCSLCVKICPAGAIKDSPVEFDHMKCFEALRSFQRPRQVEQFVCGICVNVCKGKER